MLPSILESVFEITLNESSSSRPLTVLVVSGFIDVSGRVFDAADGQTGLWTRPMREHLQRYYFQ